MDFNEGQLAAMGAAMCPPQLHFVPKKVTDKLQTSNSHILSMALSEKGNAQLVFKIARAFED